MRSWHPLSPFLTFQPSVCTWLAIKKMKYKGWFGILKIYFFQIKEKLLLNSPEGWRKRTREIKRLNIINERSFRIGYHTTSQKLNLELKRAGCMQNQALKRAPCAPCQAGGTIGAAAARGSLQAWSNDTCQEPLRAGRSAAVRITW